MALIVAVVVLKTFEDDLAPTLEIIADLGYNEAAEMLRNTPPSTGFVISVAVVDIATEIGIVIIRLLNMERSNSCESISYVQ